MTVRFRADADLNQTILLAVLRREPGIDFQSASAGELPALSDPEVLAKAAQEKRVLITHDKRTMPKHFAEFIAQQVSAGVLIVPQWIPVAAVADDILLIHAATDSDEWLNRLFFLPI
jgi:hypothetical protein